MLALRQRARSVGRAAIVIVVPVVVLVLVGYPLAALKDRLPGGIVPYSNVIVAIGVVAATCYVIQRRTRFAPGLRWLPIAYALTLVLVPIGAAEAYNRLKDEGQAFAGEATPEAIDILLVQPPRSEVRVERPAPDYDESALDALGWDVRFSVASATASTDRLRRSLRLNFVGRTREEAMSALSTSSGLLSRARGQLRDWLVDWSEWRPKATHAVVLNVDGIQVETERAGLRPSDWEAMIGGSYLTPPVYAILGNASDARLREWKAWTEQTGGDAIRFADVERGHLLDAALRIASERSEDFGDAALAQRYRPKLFLDSKESFQPLDVERFLSSDAVKLCGRIRTAELCGRIAELANLPPSSQYLEFHPKHFRDRRHPTAMYYHVVRDLDGRVYVDYWWFFAYNPTPVAQAVFCRAGFNAAGLTCFDHLSDWEGVTVVLAPKDGDLRPERVIYAQHEFGVAYEWDEVRDLGSLDGDRPIVFVAKDSHASYPERCLSGCDQIHNPRVRKEGRHDGLAPWASNDDERCRNTCLKRLPQTRDGEPALWNASPRLWGKRNCAFRTSACDGVAPPRAPRYQARFSTPWAPLHVDDETHLGSVMVTYSTYE
jgi:Vacuolar protein sorting-associated protein 62